MGRLGIVELGGVGVLRSQAEVHDEGAGSGPLRDMTADTGIDALIHAVEAYVSRRANPFSDSLALNAIRTIGRHLRRVHSDGETSRLARR